MAALQKAHPCELRRAWRRGGGAVAVDVYTALAERRTTVAEAVVLARRAVTEANDITRLLYTHSGYGDTTLRGQ